MCRCDERVDLRSLGAVSLVDPLAVAEPVALSSFLGEEHRSSVGAVVPRRSFERHEAVADAVAVRPGAQAELALKADAGFARRRERVVPTTQLFVVLAADEVRADVGVMDEPKVALAPDWTGPLGVGVSAVKSHEATDHGQLRISCELSERRVDPPRLARDQVGPL